MPPMSYQYYLDHIADLNRIIARMPKAAVDEIGNGCGPAGAKIDLVPDNPLGADFTLPCTRHDVAYHLGENAENKTVGDLMFLVLMVIGVIYNDDSEIQKRLQLTAAMRYFKAVYFRGDDAFYDK